MVVRGFLYLDNSKVLRICKKANGFCTFVNLLTCYIRGLIFQMQKRGLNETTKKKIKKIMTVNYFWDLHCKFFITIVKHFLLLL